MVPVQSYRDQVLQAGFQAMLPHPARDEIRWALSPLCSPKLVLLAFLAFRSLSGREDVSCVALHVCTFNIMYFCLNRLNAPTHIRHIGTRMGKTKASGAWWQSWNVYMLFTAGYVGTLRVQSRMLTLQCLLSLQAQQLHWPAMCKGQDHRSVIPEAQLWEVLISSEIPPACPGRLQESMYAATHVWAHFGCSHTVLASHYALMLLHAPTRGTYARSPSDPFPSPPAHRLAPSTSAETLLSCAAFRNLFATEW